MAQLDEATRERIRAEEAYRAEVRQDLTTAQRIQNPPSYWGGIVLNLVIPGAGLMWLGSWGVGLAWLAIGLLLAFNFSPYVGWPLAWVASFINYNSVYDRLFEPKGKVDNESREQDKLTRFLLIVIGLVLLVGGFFLSQR
ncbi:hypothetical protein [Deinococcus sp. QL22]|uniref:hypothetical protein n=1 Tax=Deinococcus sp. QL22 TaxID=2939437 RepID=UPI002017C195|nr:hypothetical protein [Deinococcus sp. QL22]UQN06760.1 hypothetical protein M1R55_02225 [Deinococcus sp. QL22]